MAGISLTRKHRTHTHTNTLTDTQANCSEIITPPRFRGDVKRCNILGVWVDIFKYILKMNTKHSDFIVLKHRLDLDVAQPQKKFRKDLNFKFLKNAFSAISEQK